MEASVLGTGYVPIMDTTRPVGHPLGDRIV